MKSSAEYSTSSPAGSSSVRRGSVFGEPYFCCTSTSLVAHHLPARLLVAEQRADLPDALLLLLELLADDEDLEPRQAVQLQLEDRVGLLVVEAEALDDLPRRVLLPVRLPDDADDLVERVEDLVEPLEDVDPACAAPPARARAAA